MLTQKRMKSTGDDDLQCEETTPNYTIPPTPSESSENLAQEENQTNNISSVLESQQGKMDTDEAGQSPRMEEKMVAEKMVAEKMMAENSSVLGQSTLRVKAALKSAAKGSNTMIRKLKYEKQKSKDASQEWRMMGNAFIWRPIYYLRMCYRRFLSAMSFLLCLTTLTIEQCWQKVNQGLACIRQHTRNCGQRALSAIVNLTPRKILKRLMVQMFRVLPSLRHRSAAVFLSNKLPSSVTKRLVFLYFRRLPLWAIRLHTMASLQDGPIKKMIDGFFRLLKVPKTLLKTIFMALAGGLEFLCRVLRISQGRTKKKENVLLFRYKTQLSLPSKLHRQHSSPCNKGYSSDQE